METKVQRWGNSLGVRIPRTLAADVRLAAGTAVEIAAHDDAIVIRPIPRVRYTLAGLLKRVTRRNLHGEVSTGEPVGKESL
jgi:antitoxin MazE